MASTLRSQISLAFGLLVLFLTAVLSFGLAAQYTRVALDDQGDALQTLARSTATVLADGLFERMREVELLAAAPPHDRNGEINVAAWAPALERAQTTRPQYSWIGITDASGTVLWATGGMLVNQNVSARPWFAAANAQPYAGDVHPAKLLAAVLPPSITGEPLRFLDFAAPLRNRNGELRGVLGVHATWDWAHEVVTSLDGQRNRDKGVHVFIFDRNGAVIHRPKAIAPDARPTAGARLPLNGGAELPWTDGERYLTAAAKLPARTPTTDLQWTVVTRQPMQAAHAASTGARNAFLLLGFAAGDRRCVRVVARRPLQPTPRFHRASGPPDRSWGPEHGYSRDQRLARAQAPLQRAARHEGVAASAQSSAGTIQRRA